MPEARRIGTAEEWASENPVLDRGSKGFETDTHLHKVGNGFDAWNDLDYIPDRMAIQHLIDTPAEPASPEELAIVSINPTTGPGIGGTAVTVTGTGFTEATSVTFHGAQAGSIVLVDQHTITCTTPADSPGAVNVSVDDGVHDASTLVDGFLYT